jgi:hypothetical protein
MRRLRPSLIFLLVIFAPSMTGCIGNTQIELKAGFTHQEVEHALGQPDEMGEFTMPDGGFFGPQEALSGLVPAGSQVEEWRYKLGDEVTYVWFYGDSTVTKDIWRVIATATLPADAVY